MRYRILLLLFTLGGFHSYSQVNYEREFRIRKGQFPETCYKTVEPYLNEVKKLRFYQEVDSSMVRYRIKFKKDRLYYQVAFDEKEQLENIEVLITSVDIPEPSWLEMNKHLEKTFIKYKVRKIQQRYARKSFATTDENFRNAYQNLIIPEVRYALFIRANEEEGKGDYQSLYNHLGEFLDLKKSLPPNYDHVLY